MDKHRSSNINSFLKTFTIILKDLAENGVEWFDKSTKSCIHSIVIAPMATLDCPAWAEVQNLMRYNEECGCSLCEHPGITCITGLGHNRVYPPLVNSPVLRTKKK